MNVAELPLVASPRHMLRQCWTRQRRNTERTGHGIANAWAERVADQKEGNEVAL